MIQNLIIQYSTIPGKTFSRLRSLSLRDYYRMMNKLHYDIHDLGNRDVLIHTIMEKDAQRIQRDIDKYVSREKIKYEHPIIFLKTPLTVRKFPEISYILSYEMFSELCVGEAISNQ